MVQLFVYTPLITGLATRQNSPSLRNGSRHGEKAQSKIYQLLFMWRIEHEELQKQKIREQPGFVPPSRLGTNQSERIARSGYGDQRAHGSQTSKIRKEYYCEYLLVNVYGDAQLISSWYAQIVLLRISTGERMAMRNRYDRRTTIYDWGEPERAPHKRYFNARSVYMYYYYGTYVRHSAARRFIHSVLRPHAMFWAAKSA